MCITYIIWATIMRIRILIRIRNRFRITINSVITIIT